MFIYTYIVIYIINEHLLHIINVIYTHNLLLFTYIIAIIITNY